MAAATNDRNQTVFSLDDALQQLSEDVGDYWSSSSSSQSSAAVARLDATELTPIRFLREFVATNRPVIITGLIDHWKNALTLWSDDSYIENVLKSSPSNKDPDDDEEEDYISVNVTPNGWGDYVQRIRIDNNDNKEEEEIIEVFVQPEERRMKFSEFVNIMNKNDDDDNSFDGVAYISHQNDNLRTQFSALMKDVDEVLPLAYESFGTMPDATNIWIGDENAVSSLHKDHYENMYAVVQGEKHFLLFPPSDVAFLENGMDDQQFRTGRFLHKSSCQDNINNSSGNGNDEHHTRNNIFDKALPLFNTGSSSSSSSTSWRILLDDKDSTTPWIRPFNESSTKVQSRTTPINVKVTKGEVLYLPSLWYHQVRQKGRTIAVNYWHDMTFDHKWVYHNFVRNVVKASSQMST